MTSQPWLDGLVRSPETEFASGGTNTRTHDPAVQRASSSLSPHGLQPAVVCNLRSATFVATLGLVTALLSTPPPLDANNCTVLTTSPCVLGGVGSALGAERKASLSCLRRFADATSDSFGVLDNSIWQEYAPTCAVWDGVPFGVAEPLNAFSSLAFEELLCAAAWSGSPHSLMRLFPRGAPGYSAWQWWLWAACTHSQGELL